MKRTSFILLMLFAGSASAGPLTLEYTNTLDNALANPSSNFHPQGLGYDTGSNELLYMQQSSNTIFSTDLQGNITGSRTIGPITFRPEGSTSSTARHTTSVAGDGTNYYFSDYTNNSGGFDLYSIGVASGSATTISTERAGYGGYPIDVRDGTLYRTEVSTTYNYNNLNQIRISDMSDVDNILATITLDTTFGIGDIAVDSLRNQVWTLDYTSSASLRKFDLTTGALLEEHNLGLDGLTAGLTYADDTLYYYDWNRGSGSTLSAYSTSVPAPGAFGLMALGLLTLLLRRKRAA